MTDHSADEDHAHDEHDVDRPDYDPTDVSLPSRAPPLRSTAPQSRFTGKQVGMGFVVLAVGLAIVFGLPLAFA
ncbi:MAG: hypothetical protein V5A34_11770 [Halapricum sp.]